jgi:hypothetical protein
VLRLPLPFDKKTMDAGRDSAFTGPLLPLAFLFFAGVHQSARSEAGSFIADEAYSQVLEFEADQGKCVLDHVRGAPR